jgi:hypothetical protein
VKNAESTANVANQRAAGLNLSPDEFFSIICRCPANKTRYL